MFSTYLRAAANAGLTLVVGAGVAFVLGYITAYYRAPDGHILVRMFGLVGEHFVLLGLVAVAVIVVARAVVEGGGV